MMKMFKYGHQTTYNSGLVTSFLIFFSMQMGMIDTLLQNILLFNLPFSMYPTRWLITEEYGNLKRGFEFLNNYSFSILISIIILHRERNRVDNAKRGTTPTVKKTTEETVLREDE